MSVNEKLDIIDSEFNIRETELIKEDVEQMCNLSQGIKEKVRKESESKFIITMYKKGYSLEQIADVTEKSIEEIEVIIESNKPVSA